MDITAVTVGDLVSWGTVGWSTSTVEIYGVDRINGAPIRFFYEERDGVLNMAEATCWTTIQDATKGWREPTAEEAEAFRARRTGWRGPID